MKKFLLPCVILIISLVFLGCTANYGLKDEFENFFSENEKLNSKSEEAFASMQNDISEEFELLNDATDSFMESKLPKFSGDFFDFIGDMFNKLITETKKLIDDTNLRHEAEN